MTCIMCDSEEVQNQEEGKCSSWERTSTEQVVVGVFGAVHVAAFTRSTVKYLARFLDQEKKNMNITSLIVQRQRSASCIYIAGAPRAAAATLLLGHWHSPQSHVPRLEQMESVELSL